MERVNGQQYDADIARAVVARYADAYKVAKTTTFSNMITVSGLVLFAFSLAFKGGGVALGGPFGSASEICIAAGLFGALVAALGQILWATLDVAVNTSGFLNAEDRLSIMTLSRGTPAAVQVGASRISSAASWTCTCGRSNQWSVKVCARCGQPAK